MPFIICILTLLFKRLFKIKTAIIKSIIHYSKAANIQIEKNTPQQPPLP